MARPLRIEFPGAVYHVTSRGDRREKIFDDDDDRETFLAVLAAVVERFNWRCHAYGLMDNHYDLVVETLDGKFTQASIRRHGRHGHLFQGRFEAILVHREAYLLELLRYVVLTPVRAGMVGVVGDWPWSSYGDLTLLSPPRGMRKASMPSLSYVWQNAASAGSDAGRVGACRVSCRPRPAPGP